MTRMTPFVLVLASIALASTALTAPAQAASLTRTFVSSAGSDSNPCTTAQPCSSFAAAYMAVASGGIVAALDPGRYGPLTINGPVTINGNGWSAITAPASGNGITVNAGAGDKVTLIGLEIDGTGGTGNNGIVVNSAGSLTVTNCILQNFFINGSETTGNGILMQPSSGTLNFTLTNTMASNNKYAGVFYFPPSASGSPIASGVIDHVIANANIYGIYINTQQTSGGSAVVTISNSIVSNNFANGILVENTGSPSTIKASIDKVSVSGNGGGVSALGTVNVLLGRSVITGNGDGTLNETSPNTFYTYGDNRINLNGQDFNGPLNTTFSQQ